MIPRQLLTIGLLLLYALPSLAQDGDVPDIAVREALRRGQMVEEIGGRVFGTEETLFAQAVEPPADDSHKWYITLITTEGCQACERLKYDLAHAAELQAWVNVDDPDDSPTHYHVRRYEDRTQRDWLRGIKPQLERGGFPALVIQPPRSGEYGRCATTVAILHGYDGDPAKLSARIRRALTTYVREIKARAGIRQSAPVEDNAEISGPPPFLIPPPRDSPPGDWPSVINPQPLTAGELQTLVPDAPPEFLLGVLRSKVSDPAQVLQQWHFYQLQNQPQQTPPAASQFSLLQWLSTLFGGGAFVTGASLLMLVWRVLSKNEEFRKLLSEFLQQLSDPDPAKK